MYIHLILFNNIFPLVTTKIHIHYLNYKIVHRFKGEGYRSNTFLLLVQTSDIFFTLLDLHIIR